MLLTLKYLQALFGVKESPTVLSNLLTSHGLEVERFYSMMLPEDRFVAVTLTHDRTDSYKGQLSDGQIISIQTSFELITTERYVVYEADGLWELATPARLGWSNLMVPLRVPAGQTLEQAWEFDTILELSITPNRGDCLSYLGIMREISLAKRERLDQDQLLTDWENHYPVRWTGQTQAEVSIDKTLCCSYALAEIRLGNTRATPFWLERFLIKHGIAPKHLVVDMTHYVMLIFGQPMHAFDRKELRFPLALKTYPASERTVTLLTGKEVALSAPTTVIAHDDELYALAGLMGASQSAVQAQTQQVLIEAASFNPSAVRSMRFLGLTTEASGRFERGVDRHYQLRLLKIFAGLMQSVDETLECLVPIDLLKDERLPTEIALTQQDVDRLVGAAIDVQETQKIMLALGGEHDGYSITFQVPSWRFDLSIKQDIIEEIVRLYGLDRLPLAPARHRYLPIKLASSLDPWIHLGFNEVITYSFMSEQDAQLFTRQELIALANPMSQEMAVLRPSLWPSLLAVSALNARFGSRGLQLVEQASVYGEHYEQRQRSVVAAVLMIENAQRHWSSTQKKRNLDFYDVKGLLEQILAHHLDLEFEQTDSYPGLHPQLQINIKVNGIVQGIFGQLHPLLSHQKEWPMSWLIEFNADLMEGAVTKTYQAFSRLPKIHRDLALIVPQTIPVAKIIRFIENNQSQALQSVHVFDYYSGEHVAEGFISLGVELVFQHPTKTLEEIEIGLSIQKILLELKNEYGITLRD